jgi:hypothetical protein
VTRGTRWGNKFKVDSYTPSIDECIEAFEQKMLKDRKEYPEWFEKYYLEPIRGKNLACWCKLGNDVKCHANIWLRIANE